MDNLLTGTFMSFMFLVFLLIQRKKYNISIRLMIVLHVLFTITGTFGASLGSVLSGMTWAGKRLHVLMIVDTITLIAFAKLLKLDEFRLGDYLAIPVISVCAASKVGCHFSGCCYGIKLFTDSNGNAIRFPSPTVELALWVALIVWLFVIEKKRSATGLLWPIALIWFGAARFAVDFLRGSSLAHIKVFLNMPGGQLYSLLALFLGLAYLYKSQRKQFGSSLTMRQYLFGIIGKLHEIAPQE